MLLTNHGKIFNSAQILLLRVNKIIILVVWMQEFNVVTRIPALHAHRNVLHDSKKYTRKHTENWTARFARQKFIAFLY